MYIGRAEHGSTVTVGKVQPSKSALYIPYNGDDVRVAQYELLVWKRFDQDELSLNWDNEIEYIVTNAKEIFERGQWVNASHRDVPIRSLIGGQDDGQEIIVARAKIHGQWVPGKFIAAYDGTFISWDRNEIFLEEYQTLVVAPEDVSWIPSSFGKIVPNAVQGGKNLNGETLYIGRVSHDGTLTVGKVYPSHKVLYIPYGGTEYGYSEYELLVVNS